MGNSRYAEALGFWEHKIKCSECLKDEKDNCSLCINFRLKPTKADNLTFASIMGNKQNRDNTAWVMGQIADLYCNIVCKTNPMNEEDKKDFSELVGVNINQIAEDMSIAFRWTTKEALDEQKKKLGEDQKKN